jgi:hypothetical protein
MTAFAIFKPTATGFSFVRWDPTGISPPFSILKRPWGVTREFSLSVRLLNDFGRQRGWRYTGLVFILKGLSRLKN